MGVESARATCSTWRDPRLSLMLPSMSLSHLRVERSTDLWPVPVRCVVRPLRLRLRRRRKRRPVAPRGGSVQQEVRQRRCYLRSQEGPQLQLVITCLLITFYYVIKSLLKSEKLNTDIVFP